MRDELRHVFPDSWAFFLGEIALYCFIVLVATGVFLALFFRPSEAQVVYEGSYEPLSRRAHVGRLQLGRRAERRRARRAARAPGPPLGGARVRRRPHDPPPAHVLHRRLPAAAAHQLAGRSHAAAPRRRQRPLRLLAARRPALGHRSADLARHHRVDPVRRPVAGVADVRRRVPLGRPHRAHLPGAHLPAARPRSPACSAFISASCGCSATPGFPLPGGTTAPSSGRRWCPPTRCAPPATSSSAPGC